jgi:aspartate/methionine/tyrosine aminotransferase
VAEFLSARFGWKLGAANIAISNGSQSAFFALFNMLAGDMPGGGRRTIHLPLTPEYLGYADSGLSEGFSARPVPKSSCWTMTCSSTTSIFRAWNWTSTRGTVRLAPDQPHRQRGHRRRVGAP